MFPQTLTWAESTVQSQNGKSSTLEVGSRHAATGLRTWVLGESVLKAAGVGDSWGDGGLEAGRELERRGQRVRGLPMEQGDLVMGF